MTDAKTFDFTHPESHYRERKSKRRSDPDSACHLQIFPEKTYNNEAHQQSLQNRAINDKYRHTESASIIKPTICFPAFHTANNTNLHLMTPSS